MEAQWNGFPPEFAQMLGMTSSDELPVFDPVLITAEDRPDEDSLPPLVNPAADHIDPELAQRRADIEEKHQRIVKFLEESGYESVVLTRADSIAWFTAGGDLGQDLTSELGSVALFINATTRAVLSDNVQSARVFEEELSGLGFQLKERPWHHEPTRIIAELTHGKKTASDRPISGLICESEKLNSLRRPLTELDRKTLRVLGRTLTLAVEATCRSIHPGETEAAIAAQLSHRLIREGVVPIELRVAGDDRLIRYRQPTFKAVQVRHKVNISVTGRRLGLCASVSRTVSFGRVDDFFRSCHTLSSMVNATCIFFSRPGEPVAEVFRRARRIFEKFNHPHEWTFDYQGALIGYSPRELSLFPECPTTLQSGSALRWSPSVVAARAEDTILINEERIEILTDSRKWPMLEVCVKGKSVPRPGILER